ncbi:MAG: hypothetical protein ACRD00_06520 [Thermoanaerobaculia bacterium]
MERLGQILVSLGTTSEDNVARALGLQGLAGGRLGTLLLEAGSVGEDDLGEALAQQHGRPYVTWGVLGEVTPDVIASLPAKFAMRHAAVPFERGENYLKIALRDPNDLRILDELFVVTGRKIQPAVAPEARIYHALEKYYGQLRTPRYSILGEKLSPARRKSLASGPSSPHEVWADAAQSEASAPPIIQRRKIPDAPAAPWRIPAARPGKSAPSPPEKESITWEETPPPEMWLPEGSAAAAAPASSPVPVSGAEPKAPAAAPAAGAAAAEARRVPASEADFPEVLAAATRDAIAAAALAALSRRFERSAFFVVRPTEVVGHSAAGPGIDREAFAAVAIPWNVPSVFLNVRLSRAFHLGALPPLPQHRHLLDALGGPPEECLVQPVLMREKPVAFLYAEFSGDRGATPMDLAYMRGLAAAAARAFAAAIRQKKKLV